MKESTILKLCKRATKRKHSPSVTVLDKNNTRIRELKTTRGIYLCRKDGDSWSIELLKK